MGKKKDQFIDKSKAITFKLSYRENEDPFFQKQGHNEEAVVERVFEVKSIPMDNHLTEAERAKRDKLLSLFTEEEQGKFEKQPKEENPGNKFWIPPEIRAKLAGKQLWIDQLAAKSQLKEQDVEDYEVEELEDVDEGEREEEEEEDEDEEIKDQDNRENDDEKEIDTDSEDYSDEGEYDEEEKEEEEEMKLEKVQLKAEDLVSSDFPEFHYKDLVQKRIVEENIIPKYEKMQFNKDIRFKKFNEYGLPVGDGSFDYSKYFVHPSQQNVGVVEATLFANYKKAPKLAEDIDYEYDEMTEEQKEVFDALNCDDDLYEELEDDFVDIVTEGKKAIIKDAVEEALKKQIVGDTQKKNKKKPKGKSVNFNFDEDGKIELQIDNHDQKKVKKDKKVASKKVVIKKYDNESNKVADAEFDKVMKEFDDSGDDPNYQGSGDEDYDVPELENGILTGEGFNKILDDHLADMTKRAHAGQISSSILQQTEIKKEITSKKKNVEFAERQQEKINQYDGIANSDDIFKRVLVERVPFEKDNALASYIERDIKRDIEIQANPEAYDHELERPQGENKLDETIATKNFSFSKVHENLSFVGDDINLSRSKKYARLRAAEDEEVKRKEKVEEIKEKEKVEEEEGEEEEEEEEEEEVDPLKIRSYELSQKISREETAEEKKARKKALKEFKDARKQKKKLIKEGFETLAKEQQSKIFNRTNYTTMTNVKGISIKAII